MSEEKNRTDGYHRLPRSFFKKERKQEHNNDSLKALYDFDWSKEALEGKRKVHVKEVIK